MLLIISSEKYQSDLLNTDIEIYKEDGKDNYWFHGASVCDIFGFKNPSLTIQRHVDDEWRVQLPQKQGRDAWFIAEPGFYQLLHASKHPAAKRFQKWVYSEVLPKLRAEGGYIMPSATVEQAMVLVEHHKNRIANLAKVHEEIQYKTGLYDHPRLALESFIEVCSTDFSDADKEEVKDLVHSHSRPGNYSWKVPARELSKALLDVVNIKIPVRLLTYWLAEWGYNVKASGGRQKTGMYSVEMLPLTRDRKLKMVDFWIARNKKLYFPERA